MNMYKRIGVGLLLVLTIATGLGTDSARAQRRATRRPPAPVPTPVPDMRAQALQVAEQVKNLSRFVYLYGKIVNGLEVAQDQAKRGQTSPTVEAKNKQAKEALVANITGLRVGIQSLARTFQGETRLQVQYLKISAATDAVANAEQLAAAGRYDEAGTALTTAIERLTDTIVSMRLQ